jgi:hypothetical protein
MCQRRATWIGLRTGTCRCHRRRFTSSPATVSSGPMLRRDIIVTTPTQCWSCWWISCSTCSSESAASVSDDAFFLSGARSSGEQSTFHSLSSTLVTTEESSGSGTVIPSTNRVQGHCPSTSAEASRTGGPVGLSRSCAVRTRRDGASSVSYSSSSPLWGGVVLGQKKFVKLRSFKVIFRRVEHSGKPL